MKVHFHASIIYEYQTHGYRRSITLAFLHREEQRSREAESRYQKEVETMGSVLGVRDLMWIGMILESSITRIQL